jgi:hypothetical protein
VKVAYEIEGERFIAHLHGRWPFEAKTSGCVSYVTEKGSERNILSFQDQPGAVFTARCVAEEIARKANEKQGEAK